MLSYVEAILRTYNEFGRRDNIYKARIKILVHELGAEAFAKEVEAEWQAIKDGTLALDDATIAEIAERFRYPAYLSARRQPARTRRGTPRRPRIRRLGRQLRRQPQNAGLRHRYALAQAGRRHAR